jgi:hypothetical protein
MRVADAQTMLAETQMTVTNTETMVSDIHRNMLTGQTSASGQNNPVGVAYYL